MNRYKTLKYNNMSFCSQWFVWQRILFCKFFLRRYKQPLLIWSFCAFKTKPCSRRSYLVGVSSLKGEVRGKISGLVLRRKKGPAKKDVKGRSRSLVFTPLPGRFFWGEGGKSAPPPSFSEASKVKVMTFSKVAYSFIENEQKLLKMIPCRVSYASKHKWCL